MNVPKADKPECGLGFQETTQTHKVITVQTIRNLLHFISDNAKSYGKLTEMKQFYVDVCTDLSFKDPFGRQKPLQELEEAVRICDRLQRRLTYLKQDLSSVQCKLTTTEKENKLLVRQLSDVKKQAGLNKERLKGDIYQLKEKKQDARDISLQQHECKKLVQDGRVEELEQINKQFKNDICKLKQSLDQVKKELDETRIKLKETEKKSSRLPANIGTIDKSKNELGKQTEHMKEEIDRKQQIVTKLQSDIECQKKKYEDLKQSSDATILKERTKNVELESTKNELGDKIKQNQQEAEKLKKEVAGILQTNAELESILQKKDTDLKLKQDNLFTMQQKNSELQNKYELLETTCESQKLRLESLKQTIEKMEMKKEVKVQLFTQNRAGLVTAAEEALMAMLKRKINSESTELRYLQCVSASEIQPDLPLMLLCITASRLGTDAQTAVHGLYLNSKTALVIFHHKDEHALPSQASERVLTGLEFKKLGGIFDMAFLKGRGLYECELNTNSIIRVSNFITKEGLNTVNP